MKFIHKIQAHLKEPLYKNSYLLIAMQVLSTLFGFVFWALAARMLPAEDVGLASGTISVTMLLSGLAQFGLGYGLVRYLSKSDHASGFVNLNLLISGVGGALLAIIFILTVQVWSPALEILRASTLHLILFIVLIFGWTLSVMLNWIFIATRRVIYSLTRQTSHMIVAVLLLLVLSLFMRNFTAVLLAHTLAVVFSVIISLAALRKALPEYRVALNLDKIFSGFTIRRFTIFSLTNYAGEQVQRGPSIILPLIVINLLGPSQGAYFFVVWTIGMAMPAWISSTAQSLFAEGSNNQDQAAAYAWRSARLGLLLVGGLALVMIVGGRLILSIYGPDYVENGLYLLYAVALAAVPSVLISIFVSYLRILERVRAVFVIQSAVSILGLLFIYFGIRFGGLLGAGIGLLLAELFVLGISMMWWWLQKKPAAVPQAGSAERAR
jgi:O-antigen/teichoic acid export membrane protein